ncbi:MAG: hypothetical protein IID45_07655 [Planctomycetes bacterium]|nr:hypothetical protein [Planctomycetota bacterium]
MWLHLAEVLPSLLFRRSGVVPEYAVEQPVRGLSHLVGEIVVAAFALLGGLVASYFDPIRITDVLDPTLAYGVYTLIFLALSFPIAFIVIFVPVAVKARAAKRPRRRLNLDGLRLAEEMLKDGTWYESQEHSLTFINETGHDLKECYIMLDEVAWKDFDGEWQVMSGDVFSEPFDWNGADSADRKIKIDNGDRASFALIAHHEYSIYNASTKQNEATTDFRFVFYGGQYTEIGYGPDIRLRISIRGKDEAGESLPPILYLLYVSLLQQHGIPKVDVVKTE